MSYIQFIRFSSLTKMGVGVARDEGGDEGEMGVGVPHVVPCRIVYLLQ